MDGLNKVMVIGNLGTDPELRYTPSGSAVTNFRIACNRSYRNTTGDRVQQTEWFTVVCWMSLAEFVGQYLRKGRKVYVEGRLQNRQWTGDDGQVRHVTEIVANQVLFLDNVRVPEETPEVEQEELPWPPTHVDGQPI